MDSATKHAFDAEHITGLGKRNVLIEHDEQGFANYYGDPRTWRKHSVTVEQDYTVENINGEHVLMRHGRTVYCWTRRGVQRAAKRLARKVKHEVTSGKAMSIREY